MRSSSILRAALVGTLVASAGCGSSGGSTGPGGNNNPPGGNGGNSFTATIDGAAWAADANATAAVRGSPGLYSISGLKLSGGYSLVFQLYNIGGIGTYTLGATAQMFGGGAIVSQVGSDGWSTPLNGEAGQITFTTLTDTRMVGTFSFVATPLSGSGASRTITNGRFDLPITGQTGVTIPDNLGSKFTGTFGGVSFNAGAGQVSLTNAGGANPVLTIAASNGTRNVGISIANMTGPGTYALSATTPVRNVQTTGIPGNLFATWASQVNGGSGSVVVTSVTATRIKGTFTATMPPLAGGATGTITASGTFDMGRLFPGT